MSDVRSEDYYQKAADLLAEENGYDNGRDAATMARAQVYATLALTTAVEALVQLQHRSSEPKKMQESDQERCPYRGSHFLMVSCSQCSYQRDPSQEG